MIKYGVIHITTGGELFTPLVASQLYDQAEELVISINGKKPYKVAAWALESMRVALGSRSRNKVKELKKRCPSVDIRCIGGVNRLKDWPRLAYLKLLRKRLFGDNPVIYHCRGEAAVSHIKEIKVYFPNDKLHLDIRGHWPSESLYRNGIEIANSDDYVDRYYPDNNDQRLLDAIQLSNSVSTVSDVLKHLIDTYYIKKGVAYVVPCCVTRLNNRSKREEIRSDLGVLSSEKLIVYSGGTAAYQHLEDVLIPLVKQLITYSDIKILFLSYQKLEIESMLQKQHFELQKVMVESVSQEKVLDYLSACDAGLMIRKPTMVNQVANPVKIAEYLSAGVPVILQKGIGGVEEYLEEYKAGLIVDLFSEDASFGKVSLQIDQWLHNNQETFIQNSQMLASDKFLWNQAIEKHISNYCNLFN